jgi:membrane dipeptidase
VTATDPGLTDIHAHPAMNAFLWDRDLRKHYMDGRAFNPLASLSDFKMLEKGGVKVLWSSLHVPERAYFDCWLVKIVSHFTRGGRQLRKLSAWDCLLAMKAKMEFETARAEGFEIVRSNAQLDAARAKDRTAIVHTVEGGHVLSAGLRDDDIDGRIERLDQLADDGVASLTLAHLFPNDLAGHAEAIPTKQRHLPTCPLDTKVDLDKGLTEAGKAVVKRMTERRMLVDVTHCTPKARHEIYGIVNNEVPIVASHIGVQSLNPEKYNLDESDVTAIAASKGVIGVIFMPHWLETADPKNGLDAIHKTMAVIHDWTGTWDNVAIGTDFDGFTDPPDDCDNAGKLGAVREHLHAKGVSNEDAVKILGGNARRALNDAWR